MCSQPTLSGILRHGLTHCSSRVARFGGTPASPLQHGDVDEDEEWTSAKPFNDVPGPRPLPLIGNVWRLFFGDLGKVTATDIPRKFLEDYGPIMKICALPGRRDMVLIYDADATEKVLRNEGAWPARHGLESFGYIQKLWPEKFDGAWGLVSTNGEEWASFRSAVNQTMMQPRSTKQYVSAIDQISQELVDRMRLIRDDKNEMPDDFYNELSKWTLESTTLIALDKRLGCFGGDLRRDSEAQQLIQAVHAIFDGFFQLDMQPSLWKVFPTPAYLKMKRTMRWLHDILFRYIEEAMQRLVSVPQDKRASRGLSVLESLLLRNENPGIAVTMAMDMIIAGVDTTANTTALIMYQLAKSPEKQRRLQEELDRVFPDPFEPATAGKLEKLKYLRACIKEAMRVSPIVVGNQRQTAKDLAVCGYQIPKGTEVLCAFSEMARMERYFPRAAEFIPERWLPEGEDLKPRHPFAFSPFGFGPRSCIGRRFAQLEMETFLSKTFRNFDVRWNGPSMKRDLRFQFYVASPLRFECVDRT